MRVTYPKLICVCDSQSKICDLWFVTVEIWYYLQGLGTLFVLYHREYTCSHVTFWGLYQPRSMNSYVVFRNPRNILISKDHQKRHLWKVECFSSHHNESLFARSRGSNNNRKNHLLTHNYMKTLFMDHTTKKIILQPHQNILFLKIFCITRKTE